MANANPVQRLPGDFGFGGSPDVMKVAAQMRPTRRLTEPGSPVGFGFVKLGIAFIAIRLKDAAGLPEMLVDVVFLPVRGEVIDRPRWRRTRPRALAARHCS